MCSVFSLLSITLSIRDDFVLRIMKHFTFLALVLCSLLSVSCLSGKMAPIIVDNDTVYFGADGGTQIVSIIRNYNGWSMYGIHDVSDNKYFYPAEDEREIIEGNGIKAVVNGKTLAITVYPISTSHEYHKWIVDMGSGDAFKSIKVLQSSEPKE